MRYLSFLLTVFISRTAAGDCPAHSDHCESAANFSNDGIDCQTAFEKWQAAHSSVEIQGKTYIVNKVRRGNAHDNYAAGAAFLVDSDGQKFVLKMWTAKVGVSVGVEGEGSLVHRMEGMLLAGLQKNMFEVLAALPPEGHKAHYRLEDADGFVILGVLVHHSCPEGDIADFKELITAAQDLGVIWKYRPLIRKVIDVFTMPGNVFISTDLHAGNMMVCLPDGFDSIQNDIVPSNAYVFMVDMKAVLRVEMLERRGVSEVSKLLPLMKPEYHWEKWAEQMNVPLDAAITQDSARDWMWRFLEGSWLGRNCVPSTIPGRRRLRLTYDEDARIPKKVHPTADDVPDYLRCD